MLTVREANLAWWIVKKIYDEKRDTNPAETMKEILYHSPLNRLVTTELFATVTRIKEHDGRIYPENRKKLAEVETNPDIDYMNLMGLDDIHTTHINQLITELLK